MCVEKIEYFYPVENGNFTFSYHGNFEQKQEEITMNIRFNYGFYKLNTQNVDYKVRLQIERSDGKKFIPEYMSDDGQNGRIFSFNSGKINYASQYNDLGNAYFYVDTGDIALQKNNDYRAVLSLLDDQGNELDRAHCYFDVKGDE